MSLTVRRSSDQHRKSSEGHDEQGWGRDGFCEARQTVDARLHWLHQLLKSLLPEHAQFDHRSAPFLWGGIRIDCLSVGEFALDVPTADVCSHRFLSRHLAAMRDDYIKEALKTINDPNILINVVSRRVKQLKRGNRPLVESLEKLSPEDTALREVIEGKISHELAAN